MKSKFKVIGMHCTSCAMIIENEISKMGEVSDVDCNYKKGILEMDSENEITEEELNEKFVKPGYLFKRA